MITTNDPEGHLHHPFLVTVHGLVSLETQSWSVLVFSGSVFVSALFGSFYSSFLSSSSSLVPSSPYQHFPDAFCTPRG